MKNEKCPMCHNNCLKENLGCGRGIAYFNNQNNSSEPTTLNDQVIMDLRRCGHLLHHNRDLNVNKILSNISEDELKKLHELLSRIYNNAE